MNPIMQAIIANVVAGRKIVRVTVDNQYQPTRAVFEFADGRTDELPVECDHQTFMGWWKQTSSYIHSMRCINELENLE